MSRNPQFREMKAMESDGYLAKIQNDWLEGQFGLTIHSYCAYEKEKTHGILVVDQGSAVMLCNAGLIAVQANHIEIAKPANRNAVEYLELKLAFNHEMVEILTNKQALVDRGYGHLDKSEWDQAIKDFNEAIRLDPEYVPAFKNRGAAYLGKHDYVRAIEDYNKAIGLEPGYAEHFYNRGAAYFGKLDYDRAIKDFTKAIRLNFSDKALASYARGIAKQCKGDRAGGQGDIAAARHIDPNVSKRQQVGFFVCFATTQ